MNQQLKNRDLFQLLSKMYLKRLSVGLKRIILYQCEAQSSSSVGHYDYQCEGLITLKAIFHKKQQSHLVKAFNFIKFYTMDNKKRDAPQHKKPCIDLIRRRNVNTTYTHSTQNYANKRHDPHIRQEKKKIDENQLVFSNVQCKTGKLEGILIKLKEVNNGSRMSDVKQFQDQYELKAERSTFCPANSRSREVLIKSKVNLFNPQRKSWQELTPKTNYIDRKRSRREFILNKISQIEASLSQMTNSHQNIYADYNDDIQNETFNFRQQLHNIQLQRY